MTQEELTLKKLTAGKENPFRVPDGYFDTFTERLMKQLPAQEQPKKVRRLMPTLWRYAAAVLLVAVVGTGLYVGLNDRQNNLALTEEVSQEEYYNEALDYIMVNNMEIAEYLTEAE